MKHTLANPYVITCPMCRSGACPYQERAHNRRYCTGLVLALPSLRYMKEKTGRGEIKRAVGTLAVVAVGTALWSALAAVGGAAVAMVSL